MYYNGTEQKTWNELKTEVYKGKSIPKDGTINIIDYNYVFGTPIPECDTTTQKVVELTPTLVDGRYYKAYEVVELTAEEVEASFKASVPTSITMRQARLALIQAGLLNTVNSTIANGTDEVIKVEWEYADEVRRDWDSLITMASSLGMTEKQLDTLFIEASKL